MSSEEFKNNALKFLQELVRTTGPVIVFTIWLSWQFDKYIDNQNLITTEMREEQKEIRIALQDLTQTLQTFQTQNQKDKYNEYTRPR